MSARRQHAVHNQISLIREQPMPTRVSILTALASAGLLLATPSIRAQTPPTTLAAPTIAADPKDVASEDAIVAALYDAISGPAGQKRNWDRFRSLFVPGARLIPTGVGPDNKARIRTMTPDEYATSSGPRL